MSAPPPVRPDVSLDLDWEGDLRFRARAGGVEVVLDSDGRAGPSPVQALAMALAGCMAIDLVHILRKGRLDVRAVQAALAAERASADPRRLVRVRLHFRVAGDVPPEKVERAIALSHDTYCSVWHSLRADIEFATSFEVSAAP